MDLLTEIHGGGLMVLAIFSGKHLKHSHQITAHIRAIWGAVPDPIRTMAYIIARDQFAFYLRRMMSHGWKTLLDLATFIMVPDLGMGFGRRLTDARVLGDFKAIVHVLDSTYIDARAAIRSR